MQIFERNWGLKLSPARIRTGSADSCDYLDNFFLTFFLFSKDWIWLTIFNGGFRIYEVLHFLNGENRLL